MTDYPPRPTQDPGPPQWTGADLTVAKLQGRDHDIVRAHEAGQLRDLLHNGDGTRHGDGHASGRPMDLKTALAYEALRKEILS